MTVKALLDLIATKESGGDYNAIYSKAVPIVGRRILTAMSLAAIHDLQDKMKPSGSSACGRYQFIQATLDTTRQAMGVPVTAIWTPECQDRMATHLLKNRGLDLFLQGLMTRENFANNLAKEWASLPVVTAIQGAHRKLSPGETYYAGDGLNKALHSPQEVLFVLDGLRASPMPEPVPSPPPSVPPLSGPPKEPYRPSIQVVMAGIMTAVVAGVVALLSQCHG
jgi:muramidase (phage lysozyme)